MKKIGNGIHFKIFCLIILLLFCVNIKVNAKAIKQSKVITAPENTWVELSYDKFLKIVVKSRGYIKLDIDTNKNKVELPDWIELYDSKGKPYVESPQTESLMAGFKHTYIALLPGTYYLYKGNDNVTIRYNFKYCGKNSNYKKSKAKKLENNKIYTNLILKTDSPKKSFTWYTFSLSKKTKTSIKHTFPESSYFWIYNSKGKLVLEPYTGSKYKQVVTKYLPKGKYYVIFETGGWYGRDPNSMNFTEKKKFTNDFKSMFHGSVFQIKMEKKNNTADIYVSIDNRWFNKKITNQMNSILSHFEQ